jgi:hypothetical protein
VVVGPAEAVAPRQAVPVEMAAHPGGLVVMVARFRQVAVVAAASRPPGSVVVVEVVAESAVEPVASPPPEWVLEEAALVASPPAVVVQAAPVAWVRLAGRPPRARAASGEASDKSGTS